MQFSENIRYILQDINSFYELSSAVDKMRLFLMQNSHQKLQNNQVHLFYHLANQHLTLGLPVVGLPDQTLDEHEIYYQEDYDQAKIYRTSMGQFNLLQYTPSELTSDIEMLIEEVFDVESPRPEIARVIISDWNTDEKMQEKLLQVDFFLD